MDTLILVCLSFDPVYVSRIQLAYTKSKREIAYEFMRQADAKLSMNTFFGGERGPFGRKVFLLSVSPHCAQLVMRFEYYSKRLNEVIEHSVVGWTHGKHSSRFRTPSGCFDRIKYCKFTLDTVRLGLTYWITNVVYSKHCTCLVQRVSN